MTISWLLERMTQWEKEPAIVWHHQSFTYGELLERIAFWRRELGIRHIQQGQVVALEGDYSPNSCALLLALVGLGAIVVPLAESMKAHHKEFMSIAETQAVISFLNADHWQIAQCEVIVTHPLTCQLAELGDPGLVLFSSGSTGKSKASLHNFVPLLEKFKLQRHRLCTLTFLLLDHIGGVNTLLYTLSNGGTAVSVRDRGPETVCQAIELHKVQLLPTSPTFLNLLLISEAYQRYDLSSLELISYGTEVMPKSTLKRLREVFPDVRLLQTYGLSELGILRSKSRSSDSLWMKVGGEGFETKVVDSTLWIRAKSAMLGYLNAPSPFDEEGWMDTGDVVEVDGDYIHILGRQSEIINVGGQKVYPLEVENLLMQMSNVRDVVVCGEENPVMGNIMVARVNLFLPEEVMAFKRRMRAFCKDRIARFKIPVRVDVVKRDQFSPRFKKVR